STIGAGSQPTITFTGALPSPTSQVAFALTGQCSSTRVGTTAIPDSDTEPLGSSIPSAGTYKLCYTVNSGVDWVEQATPILTVVSASPSSISAISPSSIARGSQPVMTFTGAIPTTSTKIAFALSGQCSSSR